MNRAAIIWTCSNCGAGSPIPCRTCGAHLAKRDQSLKKCETCGSPVDKSLFDCEACDSRATLNISSSKDHIWTQVWFRRLLKLVRLLVGTAQMIGLITIAVSCSISGGEGTLASSAPSIGQMQLFGVATFFGLIPIQIYLIKRISELESLN